MDLESLRYLYLRRVIGTVLSTIGLRAADSLARKIGRGIYDLNTVGRRRAESRLCDWSPSADEAAVRKTIAGMYQHAGRFWVESLYLNRLMRDSSWRRFVTVHREDRWRELEHSSRGCLIATACVGNVGVLAWSLGQFFRPVYVIADKLVEPVLRAWQRDLYQCEWVRVVDRRTAAKAIPQLLEEGEAVMLLAESERPRGRPCDAEFLGRRLRCYPTLPRLAKWFKVPIVTAVCTRREEPFLFDLHFGGIVHYEQWNDESAVMQETLARLEGLIARQPAQYLWSLSTQADAAQTSTMSIKRQESMQSNRVPAAMAAV